MPRDQNFCGNSKPIFFKDNDGKAIEQMTKITREKYGEDVFKQGGLGCYNWFHPDNRDLSLAEAWLTNKGWKFRLLEDN